MSVDRRRFLHHAVALGSVAAGQRLWALDAGHLAPQSRTRGQGQEHLHIAWADSAIAGQRARHIRINEQFPAPCLRWREGDELSLHVHNHLDEATSIHWHGLLLPWQMDGVPGLSFAGIAPGESFTYRFKLRQSGTYWYHSHSGLQEQLGHYGAIVIEPAEAEPVAYDREHVLVLSDWTFESPERVFHKLKAMSGAYNYQQRTVGDFIHDVRQDGLGKTVQERWMWGQMRMSPTDLSDVTAATYTYLLNGLSPLENWSGLFRPGERVRLRIVNAAAMTIFNLRIPGLPMTVVMADGIPVQPVDVDEFQIGAAETFDVIVCPQEEGTFTIHAETIDRSGFARGILTSKLGLEAPIPPRRARPLLTMKDMGMDHGSMDHGSMDHGSMDHAQVSRNPQSPQTHRHPQGPGVASVASNPVNRLSERPLGLEHEPHRVLVYSALRSLSPNPDPRPPARELELHLTANMERYMWSFDGQKFSEVTTPLSFALNERVRITFVNDTMMPHPLHLHGMFFEVVTGEHAYKPRKNTLVLKPGERTAVDLTADAPGPWAFHCHLLYHMHAGMMRVFEVGGSGAA